MSKRNQTAAAPAADQAEQKPADTAAATGAAEGTDEAQAGSTDAGVTQATESAAPEGVVTTDTTDPETTRAFPHSETDLRTVADVDREIKAANAYVVAWHVKAGGTRYVPGDVFPPELVTPELLASGAITLKG
jgi:hypothetical protein